MTVFQFVGAPCFQHTNYVFYKAFKYKLDYRSKILALGDFFFLKILQEIPLCIAEIELLWEDKASNQLLSCLRLYFKPEDTPDGRQDDTGKDEVLALGERIVLRLDDLVPIIKEDVKWVCGSFSPCSAGAGDAGDVKMASTNGTGSEEKSADRKPITQKDGVIKKKADEACDGGAVNGYAVKKENGEDKKTDDHSDVSSGAANIAVMNYARYCRYRAMCKRLEGCENQWLHVAVVVAIGGYSSRKPGCRVMYCRDTFYQAEIDDWDCRMDHMFPVLKSKKTKKSKASKKDSPQDSDSMEEMFANIVPSVSSSSRPRRLTEPGDLNDDNVSTHEQAFLIGLHKFMHEAKMPIGRIPSLGFKQIDLYYFYKQADKLGGYDSITHKRMWKHLYDKLGGNSSNTSAATCTRKHYERLLLPYERHLRKLKTMKHKKHVGHGEEERVTKSDHRKEQVDSSHQNSSETSNVNHESKSSKDIQKGSFGSKTSEHSKYQSVDTEVLEIPVVRQRGPSSSSSVANKHAASAAAMAGFPPGFEMQGLDGLTYAQLEQLQHHALQAGDPAYANMLYQSGYLMPLLPPHLLQTQWGPLLAQSPSAPPASQPGLMMQPREGASSSGPPPAKKAYHKDDKSMSSSSHSSNKPPSAAHQNTSLHSSSSSNSNSVKPAHSNTPYVPSPYLLNDHLQGGGVRKQQGPSSSLYHSSTSHHLASLLHPIATGQRGAHPFLPPAPRHLYLDPSCINPFSLLPLPSPGAPPAAHSFSRKRSYPFDNPAVFPSPDMVLDRIRSSTRQPLGNSGIPTVHSSNRQRFDNPRDILQHTPQSFLASQANRTHGSHSKAAGSKSKSSSKRTSSTAYSTAFGQKPGALSQSSLLLQQSSSKSGEHVKQATSSNGFTPHQSHGNKTSSMSAAHSDHHTSSGKDAGRLTSALFGTQFTALPRSTKPSDLGFASDPSILAAAAAAPSSSSSSSAAQAAAAAAAAALSLNPHLHPAFMNPFLPATSSSGSGGGANLNSINNNSGNLTAGALPSPGGGLVSSSSSLNSQLQMLASAYGTTPAHLAAYEEMLRQNGYGAFVLPPSAATLAGIPGMPAASPHHHHPMAVAQQNKVAKKH